VSKSMRLEALLALKAAIEEAVPELRTDMPGKAHVIVGKALPSKNACFPALVIDPIRFRYLPDPEHDFFEPDPSHIVLCVGRFEATIQLRLVAATPAERFEYQEKILEAFLRTEGHPGVLLTEVDAIPELGTWLAAWEFDEDEWQDEKVFDQQLWAVATLTGVLPALVTRAGVYRINDLRLGTTGDFTTEFTPDTFDSSKAIDRVRVNQDGTIEKVT